MCRFASSSLGLAMLTPMLGFGTLADGPFSITVHCCSVNALDARVYVIEAMIKIIRIRIQIFVPI